MRVLSPKPNMTHTKEEMTDTIAVTPLFTIAIEIVKKTDSFLALR